MPNFIIPEPEKREARPSWSEVPQEILLDIEKITGKIVKAEIAWGGYSPSACFLATNDKNQSYFIKGSHPKQTAHGAKALKQEIHTYKNLCFLRDTAPKFYGEVSYNGEKGWVLGIWDKIDGSTALPWTINKVEKTVEHLHKMHKQIKREDVAFLEDGNKSDFTSEFFLGKNGWLMFEYQDDSNRQEKFCGFFEEPENIKTWLKENLTLLTEHQRKAKQVVKNKGVVHFDLRSDNIMFKKSNEAVVLLDWTDACWGDVLFDLVSFSVSVAAESKISCQEVLGIYEDIAQTRFDKEDVLTVISVISGYFANNFWRKPPEKLPRLRWVQKLQFDASIRWFCEEKGIKNPFCFV